jgi:hypothetical protein
VAAAAAEGEEAAERLDAAPFRIVNRRAKASMTRSALSF